MGSGRRSLGGNRRIVVKDIQIWHDERIDSNLRQAAIDDFGPMIWSFGKLVCQGYPHVGFDFPFPVLKGQGLVTAEEAIIRN